MITEIGICAGDIWHYLEEKETATVEQLAKDIEKPECLILMSLGWLAREGHVSVEKSGSSYSVTFQKKS